MRTYRSRQWANHGFILLALLTLLSGCSVFSPAKSFDTQLAYAYGTHTAVLTAAASAVEHGTLSSADAAEVLQVADDAKVLLDSAKVAAGVGDLTTAEGKLALATNLMQQLLDFLNARVPK